MAAFFETKDGVAVNLDHVRSIRFGWSNNMAHFTYANGDTESLGVGSLYELQNMFSLTDLVGKLSAQESEHAA